MIAFLRQSDVQRVLPMNLANFCSGSRITITRRSRILQFKSFYNAWAEDWRDLLQKILSATYTFLLTRIQIYRTLFQGGSAA